MVVVSGSWVKSAAPYPTPLNDADLLIQPPNNNINNNNKSEKMSAKAILICRPNSHPFQERTLTLDQPVKIGRSVARSRATPTNAIFDCKVLSRHHALLWYDCGKFYLQDTKSSNGTFVNNNRLSSNESESHEVCSGDIVQFGVDVVENNRKVTHCCIVATLKLYLADGKEAKASPSIVESSRQGLVPLDELYKLNQLIQEACQREQCLEKKLVTLQNIVEETQRSTDDSWQAYVGEERLLSRVSILENQLAQATKNISDERLREDLEKLQEEKATYQLVAKEALCKLHAERLEAVALATEQERARASAEQEAILAREQLNQVQNELQELAQKLMREQQRLNEEKVQVEQREHELQEKLDAESSLVEDLKTKLKQCKLTTNKEIENSGLANDEINQQLNNKLDYLENENSYEVSENKGDSLTTLAGNEDDDNETDDDCEKSYIELNKILMDSITDTVTKSHGVLFADDTFKEEDEEEENEKELNGNDDMKSVLRENNRSDDNEEDCEEVLNQKIDSKTLKYQFQSVQNELKRQIDKLQQETLGNRKKIDDLEEALAREKRFNEDKSEECLKLQTELSLVKQKWMDGCNALQHMRDEINVLNEQISLIQAHSNSTQTEKKTIVNDYNNVEEVDSSADISQLKQIAVLEEELILLKEKFVLLNDEKLGLNKTLATLQDQYVAVCNRSYNTMFFYVAPLVLMVLYLLISQYFS